MAGKDDPSSAKPSRQPTWVGKELLSATEQQAFESLEREVNQVLYELQSDPALDKFRNEFEKLHRALKKSHESEKRLIKKCRELNTEIVTNTVKVKTALENSKEDQLLIAELKEETQKAWNMVDASQEKEAKANENVRALKKEIESLTGIVDQTVELNFSKDTEVVALENEKQTVIKERDRIVSTVADLKAELERWAEKVRGMEQEKLKHEQDLSEVKGQLQSKRLECDRESRKKDRLEKDLKELRTSIETCQVELKQKEITLANNQEYTSKLEASLHEQKSVADRTSKLLDAVHLKVAKLQADLEDQIQSNTQLLAENSSKMLELKTMEDELESVRDEVTKVKKVREAILNKLKATEQERETLAVQKEQLQCEVGRLEKEVERQRKLTDAEKRRVEESSRERDVLTKMKTEAEDMTLKHMDIIKIKEAVIRNLEIEIQHYREKLSKQDYQIDQLEKELQKSGKEASVSVSKYLKALNDLREKECQILEVQKKMQSCELQIKQQKALFDTIRIEKNGYSKRLVQTEDEIFEAKRKLAISTQMIEHLKDQLSIADTQLQKGVSDMARVEKEKETMNAQFSILQDKIREEEGRIAAQVTQIDNHDFLMSQMEAEKGKVIQEFKVVKLERDLMAAQLVQKSDELHHLYEKIRVQQSTLEKGEKQYKERLTELRLLKMKLTDMHREHVILSRSAKHANVLKREIDVVGRALTREQLKVRALSEELETPENVHRWRTLMAADPSKYELITKVRTLQKRLIQKTDEVTSKDLMIQEQERLYMEMKNILASQPGPEAVEQLNENAKNLLEKTQQLKAASAELRLYRAQVKEHKAEIHGLHEELRTAERKYLGRKEKEKLERERVQMNNGIFAPSTPKLRLPSSPTMRPTKSGKLGR